MTYETAKKLKEAKFPFLWNYEPQALAFREYPSLSELIEACGDDFFSLQATAPERMSLSRRYIANGFTYDRPPLEGGQKRAVQGGIHKTPEEALANLWLRLNDKEALDNTPPYKV